MIYAILAVKQIETKDGHISRPLPTFYLHSAVQGIVSEDHAERIAADIVGADCTVNAVEIGEFF